MEERLMINLLRSIARMELNDFFSSAPSLEEFVKHLDSDKILSMNKLQLLFFKHLKELEYLDKLDESLCDKYSLKLFYIQFKYREYLNLIMKIVCIFEKEGINYSILKGLSFIDDMYSKDGIIYRNFGDVDILISPSDASKVNSILVELGLVQGNIHGNIIEKAKREELIYWSLNSHQLHEYVTFTSYASISPYFAIYVDINTTIFEGGKITPPISTNEILANTMIKKIRGQTIKCLNYTYGLLQLCYHFYKDTVYEVKKQRHDNYCLLKFCDIREYILKFRSLIEWDIFICVVNKYGIANQIYHTLMLVSSFYGDLKIENVLSAINVTEHFIDQPIDWYSLLCVQ